MATPRFLDAEAKLEFNSDAEATAFWGGVIFAIDTLRKEYRDSSLQGYADLTDRANARVRELTPAMHPASTPTDTPAAEEISADDSSSEDPEPTVRGKRSW